MRSFGAVPSTSPLDSGRLITRSGSASEACREEDASCRKMPMPSRICRGNQPGRCADGQLSVPESDPKVRVRPCAWARFDALSKATAGARYTHSIEYRVRYAPPRWLVHRDTTAHAPPLMALPSWVLSARTAEISETEAQAAFSGMQTVELTLPTAVPSGPVVTRYLKTAVEPSPEEEPPLLLVHGFDISLALEYRRLLRSLNLWALRRTRLASRAGASQRRRTCAASASKPSERICSPSGGASPVIL